MNLVQALTYRPDGVSRMFGLISSPLCQGRCCGERTAPVFVTFGTRGVLLLCADCRAWQQRTIRARIREIRRAGW